MQEKTRREVLIIVTAPLIAAALTACGGGGSAQKVTALSLTEAAGFEPTSDPNRKLGDSPYITTLKRNGQPIFDGDIYFTVRGQNFYDDGPIGTKSVLSLVNPGDKIVWYQA